MSWACSQIKVNAAGRGSSAPDGSHWGILEHSSPPLFHQSRGSRMGRLIGRYVTVFYRTAFTSAKNNTVGWCRCLSLCEPILGGRGGSLCWRQTNNSLFSSPPCFSVFYSLDSPRTSVRGRRGIYRSWAAGCCDGWFRNWSLFFVPLLNNPPKEKLFFRVPNISIILTYFRCLKRTRKGRDDSSGAAMFFI